MNCTLIHSRLSVTSKFRNFIIYTKHSRSVKKRSDIVLHGESKLKRIEFNVLCVYVIWKLF